MASWQEKTAADGRRYFRIRVRRGRGAREVGLDWAPSPSWSEKVVQRELQKVAADFERRVKAGEVVSLTEKKAAEKAAEMERAKLKTFRAYVENVFLPTKKVTLSKNAHAQYASYLEKHAFPALGDFLLTEISAAMITRLLLGFQTDHAHASCVKLYNILNGVFSMAFDDESIVQNPMARVKRPVPRKDERIPDDQGKALSVQQVRALLQALESEPLKWKVYVQVMLDLGARRGEICALEWSDIDWKRKTVIIQRNAQYTPGTGVFLTSPKNGRSRVVDLGGDTLALLKQWQRQQAESCVSKWVFNQDGSPEMMFPTSPTRFFGRLGKRIGIPGLHPHMLRHTCASFAVTNGADVASVSARLGHSDPAVTLRMYTHASEESIRRAGDAVRAAISGQ